VPGAWSPTYLTQPPRGATLYEGGAEFRVWAPNASEVEVTGDFGGPFELAPEAGGLFAAKVPGAHAGQRYQFTIVHGADRLTRIDPRARELSPDGADSILVDPSAYPWKSAKWQAGPMREQVIYELHIRSFASPDGTSPGTFASAIGRLDTLKALGVTLIELIPPSEYVGDGWGYSIFSHSAPHARYGSSDDLRRFVDEAHARGMGVLIDVVFNHYAKTQTGLYCFDGECTGNSGIYFYADPMQMTPWGPKPNFAEPEVQNLVRDAIATWLEEYRVDGFRWDSVSNIRAIDGQGSIPEGRMLLRSINDDIHANHPGVLSIAEDLKNDANVTSPADGALAFDAQWDPRFYGPMVTDLAEGPSSIGDVAGAVTAAYDATGTTRVVYSESHDVAGHGGRIPNRVDPGNPTSTNARKRALLGLGMALTTPGIPMLFEGQEWADASSFATNATLLSWSDAPGRAGLVQFTRDAIALRRNLAGRTRGLLGANAQVFHQNDGPKVIAYRRWDVGGPGDDVIVVANFGAQTFPSYLVGLPAGGLWRVRLNSDATMYAPDFGGASSGDVEAAAIPRDGLPYQGSVALGANSIVVLSQ
jgi:1,4-alpha-glucan branching enzyme